MKDLAAEGPLAKLYAATVFYSLSSRVKITGTSFNEGGRSLGAAKGVVSRLATPFVPQGVPPQLPNYFFAFGGYRAAFRRLANSSTLLISSKLCTCLPAVR
jgi:hypothetical protein